MDFYEFESGTVFKLRNRKLGKFYIVGGKDQEDRLFANRLLEQLKNDSGLWKGIDHSIIWERVDDSFILIHYQAKYNDDLFPNRGGEWTDFSAFLQSGFSIAYYNKHYSLQPKDTHNYKIILKYELIRSGFIRLLEQRKDIRLVSSLNQFNELCNDGLMYRGHASIAFDLIPSLFRDEWNETALYDSAKKYLSFTDNKYENMSLMQHYGLPTRLLDITTDKYVALFMACNTVFNADNTIEDLGEVYAFNPDKKISVKDANALCSPGMDFDGVKYVDYQFIEGNERINKQKGSFIIFGSRTVLDLQPICFVYNKESILQELDDLKYSERVLIPEPEHICHYIREKNRPPRKKSEKKKRTIAIW